MNIANITPRSSHNRFVRSVTRTVPHGSALAAPGHARPVSLHEPGVAESIGIYRNYRNLSEFIGITQIRQKYRNLPENIGNYPKIARNPIFTKNVGIYPKISKNRQELDFHGIFSKRSRIVNIVKFMAD